MPYQDIRTPQIFEGEDFKLTIKKAHEDHPFATPSFYDLESDSDTQLQLLLVSRSEFDIAMAFIYVLRT